jgi:hypothetical protein
MAIGIVEGWVAIWHRLMQLVELGAANRVARFERVFQPIHEQVRDIHRDYMQLLQECLDRLPRESPVGGWIVPGSSAPVPAAAPELRAVLLQACELFADHRERFAAERVAIRASAGKLIAICQTTDERRYLMSVVYYFLYPDLVYPQAGYLDILIERIIEDGSTHAMNSPSAFISAYLTALAELDPGDPWLRGRPIPDLMREAIRKTTDGLGESLARESLWFDKLRAATFA